MGGLCSDPLILGASLKRQEERKDSPAAEGKARTGPARRLFRQRREGCERSRLGSGAAPGTGEETPSQGRAGKG